MKISTEEMFNFIKICHDNDIENCEISEVK